MFSRVQQASRTLNRNTSRGYLTDLVRVVEVGPRDGLQNIKTPLSTETKVELITRLSKTGLRSIEVTSFVSPKWVPQMADSAEVLNAIPAIPGVDYSVLVPNTKGTLNAIEHGAKEVIVVAGVTEGFTRANLNCSVEDSLARISDIQRVCAEHRVRVRAALSCCLGCPYEGKVDFKVVARLAEALLRAGCYEVSLADTIGVGTPKGIGRMLGEVRAAVGGDVWRFAAHLHDTYGQALANVYECLNQGVRVFDSSVAGLGGCPYAPGATGNVSTEDLLYLLHGQGMQTGVDLDKVAEVGWFISRQIPADNCSRVGKALLAKDSARCYAKGQSS
ncbi:uncharacterized protein LOC106636451 [Copidosoma floridanum]|uniref:uncharacterized protein LOC106636451 n=1 Tax=Copidosoma floridanum TaxID=29053 RepID=UPI0006C9409C|nr:uncharacterized protein LOC106636451 [Copidosoma floridanum]